MKTLQDIRKAFDAAKKIKGSANAITLADGRVLTGFY